MTEEAYLEFCRQIPGAVIDQPFEGEFSASIARHAVSRKWFAVLLHHDGRAMVNLKCDPLESEFLQSVFRAVTPAYHMNKRHWISAYFGSDLPDDILKDLTSKSFRLTDEKKYKPKKPIER